MSEFFQYVHDTDQQTVYRFPLRPQVIPQPQGRTKKRIYHYVQMEIAIARADNVLTGNRWKYPTGDYPSFTYDDRYDADQAERYFMLHYAPRGDAISKEEYEILASQYTRK
jgi:hypothetical protein